MTEFLNDTVITQNKEDIEDKKIPRDDKAASTRQLFAQSAFEMPQQTPKHVPSGDGSTLQGAVNMANELFSDLIKSAVDVGINKPLTAAVQIFDPSIKDVVPLGEYDKNSFAAKIGGATGVIFDMLVLSRVSRLATNSAIERVGMGGSKLASSMLSFGAAGAMYGGLFTQGSWSTRSINAAKDAAEFATMAAGVEASSRILITDRAVNAVKLGAPFAMGWLKSPYYGQDVRQKPSGINWGCLLSDELSECQTKK
jgi:hypothetical protein